MNPTCLYGINGPVVTIKNTPSFKMREMVYVGKEKLTGEVIAVKHDLTIIQVYEDTSGLKIGEPVVPSGSSMKITLAPGIIGNIFDGIGRPLKAIQEISGAFITRGLTPDTVDMEKKWNVRILSNAGEKAYPGKIIGESTETPLVKNRIMIPPNISGTIKNIVENGKYSCRDILAQVITQNGKIENIGLIQTWQIRKNRPYKNRLALDQPLITGQRIIDTLFPLAKGGTAAIPGGFGTGKTMTQHQLAKWSNADIIIYIGCGERGNEMTQVLEDFSKLIDPKSGESLMNRTVLIANTSNMPVAAREASIYTGVTIAEYYRDMGYHVAIMADSTSRWAEALREISGRLEEMPAEEGFPAYLPSKISEFYERAGYVKSLNGLDGSVSIIGAVSPQGGDFSEPVTQNTKRFIRCFWALDKNLAYSRHYPAINWTDSYSEYADILSNWYSLNVDKDFLNIRKNIINILNEEKGLADIVKLVGIDVLPDEQKLVLEIAQVIKTGFLQQNAYHSHDSFMPITKQIKILKIIILLYEKCKTICCCSVSLSQIKETKIFNEVCKIKYQEDLDYSAIINKINSLEFL
ncbi:MAG: V-type ATP synthase subunit A [Clostridiales bacterium]|jgi:V/A-type H+-transporting ATPase subunit A|nr:V-type ATP synthase subunit A [Clostridiales bacterium]